MKISLIAAMSRNYVIGINNQLPWHLPADLQHFKSLTLNKTILMGRATFESIGKALPQRKNIVLTHQKNFNAKDCVIVHSVEEALAESVNEEELMVIGGTNIFKQFLPMAHSMYLTLVETNIDGDAFFPQWNPVEWKEIQKEFHKADEKNAYDYTFFTYEKIKLI